jgi:arabinose-5-phosphate isomerase
MMIALGDAISLCLLKRKEFKKELLKNHHPGRDLGKQLFKVKDLIHTNTPIVHENVL